MPTCRAIIADALGSMKALAPGDDPTIDELNAGLSAFRQLLVEWHEALGPMVDVDVSADYVAGANQRIRVQDGATPTITLPNAVATPVLYAPYDYGFVASEFTPQPGSTGTADGYSYRQPRDGERVEIVGAGPAQALYFYVSDLNDWAWVYRPDGLGARLDIGLDDVAPVNSRNAGHWAARLAERLISFWPGVDEPTTTLARRIAVANLTLLTRPGSTKSPVQPDFF